MTNKKGYLKKGGNLPESNMKETIKTITETPINNLTNINSEYLEEDKFSGLKRFLFWFIAIIFLLLLIGYILNMFFHVNLIEEIQKLFNNLTKNQENGKEDIKKQDEENEKIEIKEKTQPSLKSLKKKLDNNIDSISKNINDFQDKNFDSSLEKELVNKKLFNYKDTKTKLSDDKSPDPVSSNLNGNGFCYIGSSNDTRYCAEITNKNKCMSGEIFPSMDLCINPNIRKGN